MIYTDDELLLLQSLQLLEENRDYIRTGESEAYLTTYYDYTINLLKQRLYKDAK